MNFEAYARARGSEFEFDQDGALCFQVVRGDPLAT